MLLLLLACASDVPPVTGSFPEFYGPAPKNVLWISMDTIRLSMLPRYGGVEPVTPFLEALMRDSVALDRHVSCSNWTFPSVACATRGQWLTDMDWVPRIDSYRLPAPDGPTLASALSDEGYATILLTSNSWLSGEWNTDYGFQQSERPDNTYTEDIFAYGAEKIEAAEKNGAENWFLHIHIKEAHAAYKPPDEYLVGEDALPPIDFNLNSSDEHYEAADAWETLTPAEQDALMQHLLLRYKGELRFMDDQLRLVFEDFDRKGLLDDTLVVFWSDHGEQFYEHGYQTHAYVLYREENEAVGFIWSKNIKPASWTGPTAHPDLAPTTLSILGKPIPDTFTGLPVGTAPDDRIMPLMTVARVGPINAMYQNNLKMMYAWGAGRKYLYDLEADPGELNDIYDPTDPNVIAMWDELTPILERMDPLVEYYEPAEVGP